MTYLGLMGVGDFRRAVATTAGADPQLQFFENFPGHLGAAFVGASGATLSVHAVNIPLSISFNKVVMLGAFQITTNITRNNSISFGLYSLNGSTLSLANSASAAYSTGSYTATQWVSFATSATQNITPGTWYFAVNHGTLVNNVSWLANSSFNPANAIPGGFLMGRMTASTANLPASIETSSLDITGSDANRQPYIILTA